jgi:Leucine-rich repeat (LRR) protein
MGKLTAETIKAESGQFDLESVLHLDVSEMELNDVSELQKCTNLKRLALANNQVSAAHFPGSKTTLLNN